MKEENIISLIERTFVFPDRGDLLTGPGDDCAVLRTHNGSMVVTTDEQVEGTHFLPGSSPVDIACRLMRVNLSDLAGMGYVRPVSCVAGAGLVKGTPPEFIKEFIIQLKKEADRFGITIAGGNLAAARENHFYMTVWGEAMAAPILRTGTCEGDLLVNTGPLGEAKAALEILMRKDSAEMKKYESLTEFFWRPEPHIAEGRIIAENNIASAMLDNSDGFFKSAKILAEKSGLCAVIDAKSIKPSPALSAWCRESSTAGNIRNAVAYAIDGGEDYGLVFSMRPQKAELLKKLLPQAQIAGVFEKGHGVKLVNFDGGIEGFEHF